VVGADSIWVAFRTRTLFGWINGGGLYLVEPGLYLVEPGLYLVGFLVITSNN